MSFDIQTLSLSEICTDISYGYTASANTEIVGPKFLRITDIQGGVVDWDTVPYCEIPESKLNKNLLSQGDIVVARTGNSTGENYMFSGDEPSVFASYLIRFKVDSNIANPHYVWLQMRTKRWWDFVSGAKSGSAQAGANATVLGKFEVTLPPKNVQDYVVDVISCLSSKISLNTSTNQTLEEMAQAIFKSWFVDFDPVKAKMNGEQPEGMDAATASLFPEKLVESELGLIPEGWEVLESQKVATVAIGKTPPRKEPQWFSENPSNITWISIKDMGNAGTYALDSSEYLTPEAVDKFNVKVIPDNTLILSFKLTVGRVAITHGEMTTNEAIAHYKLADDARVSTNFLYSYMKQFNFESLGSTSSIAKAVNSKIIKALPIIVPTKEILGSFDTLVKPLFDKIKSNQIENQNLEALRDTLLPKLLSGEIELGETEEMAEVN